MKFIATIASAMLLSVAAVPVAAQQTEDGLTQASGEQTPTLMRVAQVVELLNGELATPLEEVFSEAFLAQVPPSQLTALSSQITGSFGKAIGIEKLIEAEGPSSEIEIRLERAIAKGMIAIDPAQDNRIIGLRFTTFEPINDSVEKIEADLNALPGVVSALFTRLGSSEPVLAIDPDKQLALGSTFKLYVLAALSQDIARGERNWSDVVELDTKSFPSGQMQDWPEGAPVTLHTLASMMISISDNTATDQLMKVVGHDRLMAMLLASNHSQMELNSPFLNTRQLFQLKGGPKETLEAYRTGDAAARADILVALEDAAIDQDAVNAAFSGGPVALDVEWFASGTDLANLFRHMGTFADETTWEIMSINKSVTPTAREGWSYVGYKGGSEPGVLNLTWLLEDVSGKHYALSLGWNNSEATLDDTQLELIAQRILSLPR